MKRQNPAVIRQLEEQREQVHTKRRPSHGEESLAWQLRHAMPKEYAYPERERRVVSGRQWRFDFAWPDYMLAVEVDGGTRTGGRHVRGDGFERDCEKLNAAALEGWTVLRFTTRHVGNGYALRIIREALESLAGCDRMEEGEAQEES